MKKLFFKSYPNALYPLGCVVGGSFFAPHYMPLSNEKSLEGGLGENLSPERFPPRVLSPYLAAAVDYKF